ncbi:MULTISPECIES: Rap1a/Tai family immunity protein [unclassified Pseudomonas]|uniref:Rap1a/Tai family immunity protein n=1 Tax=unclassified Pseudomonas TaxID=196821 RepID=UPI002AC9BE10|nr:MULTISPECIES: Rap1a/Tai family immunity protein [unclassified Pseudomonas]MEB0048444.1 Rap1a/Tai family immunity protein [Pseudomonas sp. Dout3]MEB0098028.1 Rap1a/Tai family immunity protein [Pseudomonas sp. DC1.2]WPX57054.1 Rap1a/Tai family immunity protein [Pseudomonas sp. DC1.2]
MKAWIAAAAALGGLIASGPIPAADGGDGSKFFSSCKGLLNYWDGKPVEANYDAGAMGYCAGVIHGVRISLQVLSRELKDGYPRLCLPDDYVEADGVRAVVKYIEENPDKLTFKEGFIVMFALRSAYPCK